MARWRGTRSTCRANHSTWTRCTSACSSISAPTRRSSRLARPACCGRSIAATGRYLGHKETVFQNVFDSINPKTGVPTYRPDILDRRSTSGFPPCPSTEGGHNWQSMSYHPGTRSLVIPLSQSCMEIAPRKVEFKAGSGGVGAVRKFFEMPGLRRQRRQARRLRRRDAEGGVELPAARGLPHRGAEHRRWLVFIGDLDRYFRAFDVKTGEVLWQTRLGTSVQGFPVSFTAGGKQYIAVTTGLGGGSPRVVPRTISPEIKHPNNGHAIYVFELASAK